MNSSVLLKNKNLIFNLTVIILGLFVALQIYRYDNQQVRSLLEQREEEFKKNEVIREISTLEKKIDNFKNVFPRRDLSLIMGQISNIAKNNLIEIVSIKPVNEETYPDYIKSSFSMNIDVPDYHTLGNFISQIENNKDIFIVGEMSIVPRGINEIGEKIDKGLKVNLKISTISFI